MRSLRKLITLWMTVAGLLAIQAVVTAAPAEAAITCKTYTQWTHTDGTVLHDQRICAAPASDYPRYSDWGRLVTRFSTSPLWPQSKPPAFRLRVSAARWSAKRNRAFAPSAMAVTLPVARR